MDPKTLKGHIPMLVIALVVLIASALYTLYLTAKGGQSYVENETAYGEAGNVLGPITIIMMIFLYARSVLKLIVMEGSIWERFSPVVVDPKELRSVLKSVLYYLNKVHPFAGILVIATVFFHCYFTSNFLKNLLLWGLLGLMAWQGVFGIFLTFNYTPKALKRKSYLVHAQVLTGLIILVLAGFGHLFLGD